MKDIIEMAREAGFTIEGTHPNHPRRIHGYDRDGEYTQELEAFAALVEEAARADERESLKKIDWTTLMREGSLVTWGDAQELGDRVRAAIKARGTT